MDYSMIARSLAQDADGVLIDVSSLYARFGRLRDDRRRAGRRYELALVLIAIILAKLAGEDQPSGIADWARARAELFSEVFTLKRAVMPSHNTYRRVLRQEACGEALEREASAYVQSGLGVGQGIQISLDGKTVRGTIAWGETRGLHLLAAYLPDAGVVLFQVVVDLKTNEISAAPQVLKMLDLQGKIVTGDAMFAQRGLSVLIVEAGGDYVWTVKDNQSRLKQDIEQLFAGDHECVPGFSPAPTDFQTAQETNGGHGRIETRSLTTSSLLQDTGTWPGAQQVFKLDRHTRIVAHGLTHTETAYGITSLSPAQADPKRLLKIVRGHWGIENGLHYRRDVTLQEDAGQTRERKVAHALAILNNIVLALLLRDGHSNAAQARRAYAAHPDRALQLLLSAPA
jgi:predicted transposase YbfD/YdcC